MFAWSKAGGSLKRAVPSEPWLVVDEMVCVCERLDMVECCEISDEPELRLALR